MSYLQEYGSMEITTVIGCPIDCDFCPQTSLLESYLKRSNESYMLFSTFQACLDKLPQDVRIDFSGMSEPFINKDCVRMMQYCYSRFKYMALYTTFVGLGIEQLHSVYSMRDKIDPIVIHVADKDGRSKINVDEKYLDVIRLAIEMFDTSYVCSHGIPNPNILVPNDRLRIIDSVYSSPWPLISRAGNLRSVGATSKNGAIQCRTSLNKFNRNVLLPNGDVLLCCMDYSNEFVLGNLCCESYEQIQESSVKKHLMQMLFDGSDCICRKCECSFEKA